MFGQIVGYAYSFFSSNKSTAVVTPTTIAYNSPFDYTSSKDIEIITSAITEFSTALNKLKQLDTEIRNQYLYALGSVLGQYILAPIPVIGYAAPFLFINSYYQVQENGRLLEHRPLLNEQYRASLDKLKSVYAWAMPKENNCTRDKLRHSTIQNLILILGPYVKTETIEVWKEQDLLGKKTHTLLTDELPEGFLKKIRLIEEKAYEKQWEFLLYSEIVDGNYSTIPKKMAADWVSSNAKLPVQTLMSSFNAK